MPSNTMKLSQMIARLQAELATHGDLDCVLALIGDSKCVALDGRNMIVAVELPWQKLPGPTLVFGMWAGADGRPTNMPGQVYQATMSGGEWSYARDTAPEGELVDVHKRYGGFDVGMTQGGKWFVFEGDVDRRRGPVEIVADGILAWRPRAS